MSTFPPPSGALSFPSRRFLRPSSCPTAPLELCCPLCILFRQNPSLCLLCAPELSYLVRCHLGCLHSVAHPLRTSVHCGDTFFSFALCPRAFYLSFTLSTLLIPSSRLLRPSSCPTALCSVPGPLRTPVVCSNPLWTSSSCSRAFFCLSLSEPLCYCHDASRGLRCSPQHTFSSASLLWTRFVAIAPLPRSPFPNKRILFLLYAS